MLYAGNILASEHEAYCWCGNCKSTAAIGKSQVTESTKTCAAECRTQMFCCVVIKQSWNWAADFLSEWPCRNPIQSRYF